MRAGKLRHRIKIQQLTGSDDEFGEPLEAYSDWAVVWANVAPLSGREMWQAKQVEATTTHQVEMRYLAGVDAKMRILHGTRVLQIDSVVNVDERNRRMLLQCTEVT